LIFCATFLPANGFSNQLEHQHETTCTSSAWLFVLLMFFSVSLINVNVLSCFFGACSTALVVPLLALNRVGTLLVCVCMIKCIYVQ
jgi:hypothetical protein